MVEYRNKKEERAQHHERMKILKKKHQPMLQLKEYEPYEFRVIGYLISHSQRVQQPHQSLGNCKEEDERVTPGDHEHPT